MIKIKFFCLLLCFFQIVKSQTPHYSFNPEHTEEIAKHYSAEPILFPIKERLVYTEKQVAQENPEYHKLLNEIKAKQTDSINNQHLIIEYNRNLQLVKDFVKSEDRFKKKKNLLIEAQEYFLKNNYDYLVYADDEINSSKKSKFNGLKSNETQFKYELKRVIGQISLNTPKNSSINELNELRKRLKKHPKFIYKTDIDSTNTKNDFVILKELSGVKNLNGIFEKYGKYELIKKYGYTQEGDIVNVIKDQSYNKRQNVVIQNIESKELFATTGEIFDYGIDIRLVNLETNLNDKGYKTSKNGEDIIIHTSQTDLVLTRDIYLQIQNNNLEYIDKVANSVIQFNSYISKSESIISHLSDLRKIYNSRYLGGNLDNEFLNEYRNKVLVERKKYDKIRNLDGRKDNLENFQQHLSYESISQFLAITNELLKAENKL